MKIRVLSFNMAKFKTLIFVKLIFFFLQKKKKVFYKKTKNNIKIKTTLTILVYLKFVFLKLRTFPFLRFSKDLSYVGLIIKVGTWAPTFSLKVVEITSLFDVLLQYSDAASMVSWSLKGALKPSASQSRTPNFSFSERIISHDGKRSLLDAQQRLSQLQS